MFDDNHYVPILKTKAGEMWSLMNLKADMRARLTPLLEVHKYQQRKDKPKKPIVEHVNEVCVAIKNSWGRLYPFFLDTEWLHNQDGASASLKTALDACRALGLKAIPVVKIDYDEAALDAIKAATEQDKCGYMLRLDFEDAGAQAAVGGVVNYLGLPRTEVHLLLDYMQRPMNLVEDVPKLPSLSEWLTFTAASSAFPKTISTLPKRTWIELPRHDWNAWADAMADGKLPRKPTFSDYATRCAGQPAAGGDPIVHLRYTKERKWLVYVDGTLHSGDAPKMRSICRKLIDKPEYDGRDFSQGDEEIYRIAHQEEKMGGATQWLQWCLNHHLTFTITQIGARDDA